MTPARRIVMTADAVGGVWQYALRLAGDLTRNGCEVIVATLGPAPDAAQRTEAAAIAGLTLVEPGLPLDWVGATPAQVCRAGEAVADLAERERADVVHLNSPILAAEAQFPAPVLSVVHGCVATWWRAVRRTALDPEFHWHREMTRRGLEHSARIVAPSTAYARQVTACYALARPIEVVPNGIPLTPDGGDGEPCEAVFTAGRLWDEAKDAATLDRAAARLAAPVFAAGATVGPNRERIRLPHMRLLGRLDEAGMDEWLAARPVFASSAVFEPFGLAVLEAAMAGCALVLADNPTFRELWGGAALFVPPGDDAAFARACHLLLTAPAERRRLAAAARARARRYGVEPMGAAMRALYSAMHDQAAAA